MMRKSSPNRTLQRGALFLLLVAAGPVSLGCEAILDFDRTPLQPVVEASVRETGPPGTDAAKRDTGTAGDDDDDDDKPDASDSGTDSGDAGDGGDANQ